MAKMIQTPYGAVSESTAKAFGSPRNLLAALKIGAVTPIKSAIATPAAVTPIKSATNAPAAVAPMVGPVIPSAAQALELYRAGNTSGAEAMLKAASGLTAAAPVSTTSAAAPTLYIGSQPTSYSTTTTAAPPVAPVVDTAPPAVQQAQPAAAVTYQQAIAFRDSPIGSQIPRIERLLRPSNWNNLNSGLKSKYLKEIGEAINDPIKYSSDRLKEDAASYLVFQNIPGGGGTAKAEAKDLKSNIDKYVTFLQNNGQSQAAIESIVTKGSIEGAKRLEEQVSRMNEVPVIDRIADFGLQVGLATATAGLSLPAQIGVNAALQAAQGANPADIVRNVVATIAANSLTYGIPGIESSRIIPKTLNEINATIANLAPNTVSPTVASALINAERQAVAALITKQDVAQNALAGAVGGTIADIAKIGFDDPLTQKAIGEYAKYNALGMSPVDAALMAGIDYAGDVATQPGPKTQQTTDTLAEEISPVAAPYGSKIGSDLAAVGDIDFTVPSNIANKQEFKTKPGEVGENIIKYTDADGVVSYRKNVSSKTPTGKDFGYTIVYDDLNGISYEYGIPTEGMGKIVTYSKTRPSVENLDTLKTAGSSTTEVSPTNLSVKTTGTQIGQDLTGGNLGASTGTQTKLDINKGITTTPVTTTGATGTPTGTLTGTPTSTSTVTPTGSITGATTGATTGAIADATKVTSPTTSTLTPAEQDGLSLLQRVNDGFRTDTSSTGVDKKLPPVEVTGDEENLLNVPRLPVVTDVTGEDELKKLPPVEVTYEDETILKPPKVIDEPEITKTTDDINVIENPILLDLINTPIVDEPKKPKIPTTTERASMQALSQALSIGDPGEALFGSRLGRRRNVWNVESLRLKDELGG